MGSEMCIRDSSASSNLVPLSSTRRTHAMRRDSVDVAFARALERDRRRDAAESAKRRAVEQRCDYGAFHQLVLGANLRPMERSSWFRDAARGPRAVDRFTRARSARLAGDAPARVNEEALTERAPETIDEFSRAWRRLRGECDDVKSEYLFNIPTEAFEVVFKVRARASFVPARDEDRLTISASPRRLNSHWTC